MNWLFTKHLCFPVVLFFVASLASNQAPGSSQHKVGKEHATLDKKIDVCALLTSAEVEAVQGESVLETKKSPQLNGSFVMSQCVFKTVTPAKSVSVALALPGPNKASGPTPRQLWQQQFDPSRPHGEDSTLGKRLKKKEDEGEKEASEPQLITGLGDQAYWMGNPVAGALYVLRGEKFVRISLGGIPKQSERIEKSTKLARNIMARLK